MPNKRQSYSNAQVVALTTQVDGVCPRCTVRLFYVKSAKNQKFFEIAHIYPLNPTEAETAELKDVVRLHVDVNHPDNLIPLCLGCHKKFDTPRTAQDYEELAQQKRQLLSRDVQKQLRATYQIEQDIAQIVAGLHDEDPELDEVPLSYDPKRIEQKFDHTMPNLLRRKIRSGVSGYYQYIKRQFAEIERDNPMQSQLIFTQIKAFYLKQKTLGISQPDVFSNIVSWISVKTKAKSVESAEAVASFFVQNCEVFE